MLSHPKANHILRHGAVLHGSRHSVERQIHFWPTATLRWPLRMVLVVSDPYTNEIVKKRDDAELFWDIVPETRDSSPLEPDRDTPYEFLLDQKTLYERIGKNRAVVNISCVRYDPDKELLLAFEQVGILIIHNNEMPLTG